MRLGSSHIWNAMPALEVGSASADAQVPHRRGANFDPLEHKQCTFIRLAVVHCGGSPVLTHIVLTVSRQSSKRYRNSCLDGQCSHTALVTICDVCTQASASLTVALVQLILLLAAVLRMEAAREPDGRAHWQALQFCA